MVIASTFITKNKLVFLEEFYNLSKALTNNFRFNSGIESINEHDLFSFSEFSRSLHQAFTIVNTISSQKDSRLMNDALRRTSEIIAFHNDVSKKFYEVNSKISGFLKFVSFDNSLKTYSSIISFIEDALSFAKENNPVFLANEISMLEKLHSFDITSINAKKVKGHFRNEFKEIYNSCIDKLPKKSDYNPFIVTFLEDIVDYIEIIRDEFEPSNDFGGHFLPSDSVLSEIVSKIKLERSANVIEFSAHNGDFLLPFIEANKNAKHNFKFNTFFSGSVNNAKLALGKGIDKIAKGGILELSRNSMDITLAFCDEFFFTKKGNESIPSSNPFFAEEFEHHFSLQSNSNIDYLRSLISSSIPRHGGIVLTNIPRLLVPYFQEFFDRNFSIVNAYSLEDKQDQILFVLKYGRSKHSSSRIFLQITRNLNPKFSAFKEIVIDNKQQIYDISLFSSAIVEKDDIKKFLNFSDVKTTDIIADHLKPEDDIKNLSSPLQEPKSGHIAAIAATKIINGIYINNETDTACIFSTKLVHQDNKETTFLDDGTRVEKNIKRNAIVSEATFPDGTLVTLLNTDSISQDAKEDIEDDEEA